MRKPKSPLGCLTTSLVRPSLYHGPLLPLVIRNSIKSRHHRSIAYEKRLATKVKSRSFIYHRCLRIHPGTQRHLRRTTAGEAVKLVEGKMSLMVKRKAYQRRRVSFRSQRKRKVFRRAMLLQPRDLRRFDGPLSSDQRREAVLSVLM